MLCKIDPTVGGVSTDQKTRYFNIMCSLHEILTAGAGTSPTVNPVSTGGTKDTNYNCITTLANTDAGGWLTGASNFYDATTTYNATVGQEHMDVYRASGKSTYPNYRIVFTQNTSGYFSGQFTSYPGVRFLAGCTDADPSVDAWNADAEFQGHYQSAPTSVDTSITDATAATTYPDYELMLRFDRETEFTVASTANYVIISDQHQMWYFGIRTVSGWETSRTDNPPWVHFSYSRYINRNTPYVTNVDHWDRVAAFGSTIDETGTQGTSRIWHYSNAAATGPCAITGQYGASDYRVTGYSIILPIFSGTGQLESNWYGYDTITPPYSDSPVADPSTGLDVPPAYPVVFRIKGSATSTAMGVAPGIYKGMSGRVETISNYVTASSYTINGDTYIPHKTGLTTGDTHAPPDLWFIRSA